MSNARLPKEHELKLLKKLSTDDAYRARYEKSPADALKEIGVSDDQLSTLDPAGLKPGKLADKTDIAAAHNKLAEASISEHVCLVFPLLRLNYGDVPSDKSS